MATHFGAPVWIGITLAVVSALAIVPAAVAIVRAGRYRGPATLDRRKGFVVLALGILLVALSGANLYLTSHL